MARRSAKKKSQPSPPKSARASGASVSGRAEPFSWRKKSDLIPLAVTFVVAFGLRLYFFYMNQKHNPVFNFPIMDALYHDEWAKDILAGGSRGEDVFFRGPLYPYVLAALYKLSGSSIAFAVFVQHLMGSITACVTYLIGREYFSPRVSLIAGIGAALYWPFVYFEGDLLIVTLIVMLNALTFLFLTKAIRTHGLRWFAAAGAAHGLSIIARPSVLVFTAVIPLIVYWSARRSPAGSPGWRRRLTFTAVAAAIFVMPVMIRNFVVAHAIVPVAASGGVNFYIGNNPASDGSTAIVPGTRADWWGGYEDAIAIAERDAGRKLSLSEVSSYYFKRGFDFVFSRPEASWPLIWKKIRMFWSGPERANNKFIYFFWELAGMKYIPLPGFWLVAPLGLLGMVILWPRRRDLSMFYLFVLVYSIGVIAFFVNARFRLPIMTAMILFAAYACAYLVDAFRNRRPRFIQAAIVLAVAATAVNLDYVWMKEISAYQSAFSHNTLGNAYLKMGRGDTALTHFQKADEINRDYPTPAYGLIEREVNYNMGVLLHDQGLCSRAIDALEKVSGSDEFALTALDYLGDCYLKKNQISQAQLAYQRLVGIDKNDIRGVTGLARCQTAAGNYAEAERMLSEVVDPTAAVYPPTYLALAYAQRAQGKTAEAIKSYSDCARYVGYETQALIPLAELYAETGRKDLAIETLRQAQNYAPGDQSIANAIRVLRK